MLPIRIGLVDTTGRIDAAMVADVAAALNVQVARDLARYWPVAATVSYLPDLARIPQGMWPVMLVSHLPPNQGGVHLTQANQPFAKVLASPDSPEWTIDASHEILEMLVDPSGNRLHSSQAIEIQGGDVVDAPGQLEYLVEVCDPCEADELAYHIDGFAVSDFITPHYYDAHPIAGTRYSFNGTIERPRQLRPGGYVSFVDPSTGHLRQILWTDPHAGPQPRSLDPASGPSLRMFVENQTRAESLRHRRGAPKAFADQRKLIDAHSRLRAARYL